MKNKQKRKWYGWTGLGCLILSCLFAAKYDLRNFSVVYLEMILMGPMLDYCSTILVYFDNLILFLYKKQQINNYSEISGLYCTGYSRI
jgi:hypothetical protein